MKYSIDILSKLFPKAKPAVLNAILEYAPRFGIDDAQMPMFLAQAAHESAELTSFTESLNYTTTALITKFGRHRISIADAEKYGRGAGRLANQEAIGNTIYGGEWGLKNLGNSQSGDGWKFRGRGIFQLTGRANYQRFQNETGIPALDNPDLIAQPAEAVISACWFWKDKGLAALSKDVVAATKRVNGGTNGLAERRALFEQIQRAA